jgi:hypothetical protein
VDLWGALQNAMRTWRTGRIGPDEADRLVGGGKPGPQHQGLGELLHAAKAPATAGELAGEGAAVAGFVAGRRGVVPSGPLRGRRHVRVPLSVGTVAMKVAAGVVVVAASGTAFAAETGNLSAAAQHHAHRMFSSLGVPAPAPGSHPLRTGTGAGPSDDLAGSTPSTSASATGPPAPRTSASGAAAPLGLCRAWSATRTKPHGKAMSPASRAALSAAAGGADRVDAYCTALLATAPVDESRGKPTSPPGKPTATPSHPGNGRDKTHPAPGP